MYNKEQYFAKNSSEKMNKNLRVQCQRMAKLNDIEFRIKAINDLAKLGLRNLKKYA